MYQQDQKESTGQDTTSLTQKYSEIVNALVRTHTEANILLSEIDELIKSLYMVDKGSFEEVVNSRVRAKTALAISGIIENGNREQILNDLKDAVTSLTYLGITIAFEPTLEVIGKISTWVRQNIGSGIALDITVNKSILGGAVIEYNGRVFSSTIQTRVADYFLHNNVNF